jgi:diguanylate cyclase (GGDEF)-like protein
MAKISAHPGFNPLEHRVSALPSSIATIVILIITMFSGSILWPEDPSKMLLLFVAGTLGIVYLIIFNFLVIYYLNITGGYSWVNAVIVSLGLGLLTYATHDQLDIYIGVLLILATLTSSVLSERGPSYLLVILATVIIMGIRHELLQDFREWTFHLSLMTIAVILIETVRQLKNLSRNHIRRLETITDFSRKIASTLDTKQVMALLNAAFQSSVEADTYFVGLREGDEMRLELVYDDGEYYDNQRVKLEGSLSGWVLNNQQSLFLPDLRKEVALPGVRLVLLGKHKTSLSWMGVPMKGRDVDGIIAIGSYHPNAFDKADLELLSSLAQHAAQALDNTYRHGQVEEKSRLDSLTGVYNHGHFLKLLQDRTDEAIQTHQPLSLIMLDVDFFKQYNDTYGHLAGDEILTNLCSIMKQHIKQTDLVGRWGGEEFVIALLNTTSQQAMQVAERIQEKMALLTIQSNDMKAIPAPTISQGIAVFPYEADEIIKLIHAADQRLYIAKERGRNQIEPSADKTDKPDDPD